MDQLTPEELAAQEDAAWDERDRRLADEESESAYDDHMLETFEGEYPQGWRDYHMM